MTWLDKIDTGAQYNVIPVEGLENISPKSYLQPVNIKLSRFNGSKTLLVGKCSLTLDHKNNSFKVSGIILDSDTVPILWLKTSEYLKLKKKIVELRQIVKYFFQNSMIVLEK